MMIKIASFFGLAIFPSYVFFVGFWGFDLSLIFYYWWNWCTHFILFSGFFPFSTFLCMGSWLGILLCFHVCFSLAFDYEWEWYIHFICFSGPFLFFLDFLYMESWLGILISDAALSLLFFCKCNFFPGVAISPSFGLFAFVDSLFLLSCWFFFLGSFLIKFNCQWWFKILCIHTFPYILFLLFRSSLSVCNFVVSLMFCFGEGYSWLSFMASFALFIYFNVSTQWGNKIFKFHVVVRHKSLFSMFGIR